MQTPTNISVKVPPRKRISFQCLFAISVESIERGASRTSRHVIDYRLQLPRSGYGQKPAAEIGILVETEPFAQSVIQKCPVNEIRGIVHEIGFFFGVLGEGITELDK